MWQWSQLSKYSDYVQSPSPLPLCLSTLSAACESTWNLKMYADKKVHYHLCAMKTRQQLDEALFKSRQWNPLSQKGHQTFSHVICRDKLDPWFIWWEKTRSVLAYISSRYSHEKQYQNMQQCSPTCVWAAKWRTISIFSVSKSCFIKSGSQISP